MATRHPLWTRAQQLVALRLYVRLPFGRLDGKNREIVALAEKIGRTPDALAMKACNFASLDPAFRATNRSGLSGASKADRELWAEFSSNPEALAAEAEEEVARLEPLTAPVEPEELHTPIGETDTVRTVRVRRVQAFFRAAVLTSYDGRCAVTGLATSELLVASHIIPWSQSVERRADPRNGICLSALFDRAFDRGLITLNRELRIVVAKRLMKDAGTADLDCSLLAANGRPIRLPHRFVPDDSALEHHRSFIFEDSKRNQ